MFSQHQALHRSRWFLLIAHHLPEYCLALNKRWWWSPGLALLPEVPVPCTFWWCLIPQQSLLHPRDIPASQPVMLPVPLLWRFQVLEKSKPGNTTLFLWAVIYLKYEEIIQLVWQNLIILQRNTKILILLVHRCTQLAKNSGTNDVIFKRT